LYERRGISWLTERTAIFSERTLLHGDVWLSAALVLYQQMRGWRMGKNALKDKTLSYFKVQLHNRLKSMSKITIMLITLTGVPTEIRSMYRLNKERGF
jgi:hypothetical protein